MFQRCEETEIYRIKSNETTPRALRLKRQLIMALSFLGKEHRRKLKPKVQPRDSLTFIPPVTNFMGLFKSTILGLDTVMISDEIADEKEKI